MGRILLFYLFIFIVCLHYGNFVASLPSSERLNKGRMPRNSQPNEDFKVGEKSSQNVGHLIRKRARRIRYFRRPQVAFQATLTKPSATVKMLDTIIFNNVITNIANAYNRHTGVFTAPISGTYTFNTNLVAEIGHYVEASIVRNNVKMVSAISDHRIRQDWDSFTTWDQGNAVAIIKLKKGDKVSVTLKWPHGSHVIHGIGKSSFSGYLLR